MLDTVKDFMGDVGATSAGYARRLGCSSRALARRVGPRRGAIALGVLAAAGIGIPLLVRYLRSRRAAAEAEQEQDLGVDAVIITEVTPIPASAPFGPGLA